MGKGNSHHFFIVVPLSEGLSLSSLRITVDGELASEGIFSLTGLKAPAERHRSIAAGGDLTSSSPFILEAGVSGKFR